MNKKIVLLFTLIVIAAAALVLAMKVYNFGFFAHERLGEHLVEGGEDIFIVDENNESDVADEIEDVNEDQEVDEDIEEEVEVADEEIDENYKSVQLGVPYLNESPDGSWTGPWKNACEEASITMVESYYTENLDLSVAEAMEFMMSLFDAQDAIWGSNTDADAERAKRIINENASYTAEIVRDPTIDEIKNELANGRPVISFHYGKLLYNPGIPFLSTGSYYHVMVIIGYDDETGEFITNDDGDIKNGAAHRYEYDLFMNSLADFDFATRTATGPPTVIFTTYRKQEVGQ